MRKVTTAAANEIEMKLRPAQMEVFQSDRRFRVLVAGRRFGKTHLAMVELLRAAWGEGKTVWYVAPSYRQAKYIAWERLKTLTTPWWETKPNETELTIRLRWGATIALRGADNYDSLRGNGIDFAVLDEYASMKPECWTEALRPALSDRQGGALFIGTPQGRNHFYERYEFAQNDADWEAFKFSTIQGGNVSADELASAARDLDERLFRQEFEASFEEGGAGRAYYAFSREENVKPCEFVPGETLIWSLDFNVNPMCSVLAQRVGDKVHVLEEMILEDANTLAACDTFLERTVDWRGQGGLINVELHGDASGYQRRTCGTDTDWSLLREFFARWRGEMIAQVRAMRSNPGVRDRVNLMNSALCNAAGERRLFIDPRCKELIRDLERVSWMTDAQGQATSELDKSDAKRTHASDALGYYVAEVFAMRGKAGLRGNGRLV